MTLSSPLLRTFASAVLIVALASFAGRALAQSSFTEKPFTDISEDHPNYEAIEYLRQNNIIKGYIDGEFKADRRINRAEFVQLITNPFFLQGEKVNDCLKENSMEGKTRVHFSDVNVDAWYAEEVCIAYVKDLIDGYPDGTFKPGRNISFVEAAKIIANTFVLNVAAEGEMWYEPYVTKMGDMRAIPTTIGTLNSLMTRGEVAEMLFRVKTQNNDKSSHTYASLKGKF